MNARLLIDAIVRQTMVLIAQLATSGGLRSPLAHVAGQAFLELSKELESQGVTKKVSADMFGMALRTYQRRTQRLSQSRTDRGRSLWEALLEYIDQSGVISREEIFRRFRHDDEASLRGVLRDLIESGLIFASGSGRAAVYRLATKDELGALRRSGDRVGLEAFVWTVVYREGGGDVVELARACGMTANEVRPVLEALMNEGRIERVTSADREEYRSRNLVLGFDDPAGWEASVLDHFSTVVRTIAKKLGGDQRARASDEIGGSTYHFVLWRGHPLETEILGELRRFRERMTELRARVDAYNAEHGEQAQNLAVDAYYGQTITEDDDNAAEQD